MSDAEAPEVVTYKTTATVHSYQEGDAIVNATLPNGVQDQVKVAGATVELIDHNGSTHTHRFLNLDKARAIFGAVGSEIACTYTVTKAAEPVVEEPAASAAEVAEA